MFSTDWCAFPGCTDPTKIEPDLAERWETAPDGRSWTFHLRKGVKFHGDFGELSADDVVDDLPVGYEDQTVLDLRHDYDGDAGGDHLLDDIEHLAYEFGIERGCWLVEQQELGFHRKGTRDSNALLLPSGSIRA